MAMNIPRRSRRRLLQLGIILFLVLNLWYLLLPSNSSLRLAVNFNSARFSNYLTSTTQRDAWLGKPAQFQVNLQDDVGYLLKTGYGTRHRIPAQLEAFRMSGELLGHEGRDFLVVGDWTTVNETDARLLGVEIHDAVKTLSDTEVGRKFSQHTRFAKYQQLQLAIKSGDEEEALRIGQEFGWELDALKFISGMELLYRQMPRKKWYIILDDDTYVIPATLELILSHLDSEKPHYIGNAVGDYRGRFAHGGSAVVLSGQTMRLLFKRPDIVSKSYFDSLDETWGDKLVATTLQKLGIYLDERYSHYFNGEPPEITRIAADRFCSPIVSFHSLRHQGDMAKVARAVGTSKMPIRWGQLWELFSDFPLQLLAQHPLQSGEDHVGNRDEKVTTWQGVNTAGSCRKKCESNAKWCMAWTYETRSSQCHGSPWMIIGVGAANTVTSGVNWPKVSSLHQMCP